MIAARGAIGILSLCLLAWLMSSDRRRIPWKTVLGGMALQWALALLVLKTKTGEAFFDGLGSIVATILLGADAGASFVFGPLAGDHEAVAWKAVAGIKIMTTIVAVATLASLGYHYGILQRVVRVMAKIMTRALGVTGAESLSGAANVFLGQTEAPFLVRPLLPTMTRSELMAIMTGGFATISAGVMAYYVTVLGVDANGLPDQGRIEMMARHLLTASLMSAPAAFVMAKIMVPPGDEARPDHAIPEIPPRTTSNGLDAATTGATEGMKLAINVIAMLIAFIALIKVLNIGLSWLGRTALPAPMVAWMGLSELNLDGLMGLVFAPIAWLNGVEWVDCRSFGGLMGTAMATNEMIAYGSLSLLSRGGEMSERSVVMATYSLCGFANLGSIGIQIGGIGSLVPERRRDLVQLGFRAMLGGAMACWSTGAIAGMLIA